MLTKSFQRYWWAKNSVDWLHKKHNWSHPNQKVSLRFYLSLMIIAYKKIRYPLTTSRDVDDQRILHSDWFRAICTITGEPDFSQRCNFCRIIKMQKIKKNCISDISWPLRSKMQIIHAVSYTVFFLPGFVNCFLSNFHCRPYYFFNYLFYFTFVF